MNLEIFVLILLVVQLIISSIGVVYVRKLYYAKRAVSDFYLFFSFFIEYLAMYAGLRLLGSEMVASYIENTLGIENAASYANAAADIVLVLAAAFIVIASIFLLRMFAESE
ncbi:MAG: hypothetical protein QXJ68_01160 [Methanocellales archaeon]